MLHYCWLFAGRLRYAP